MEFLKTTSDLFEETVYVVDFHQQNFRYVSNKGLFLCGRLPEEILQLGYKFYTEVIHQEDFQLVAKIHQVVLNYFTHPDTPIHDLTYMVFDFRIRGYKGQLRLSQKVVPLMVNNQVRMAVCCVNRSVSETSGNLFAYYNGKKDIRYQYSFEGERWEEEPMIKLSRQEWDIISLSKQGITGYKIADILGITHQTLRNAQTGIFQKLNTNSMTQSVIFTGNHRINVVSDRCNSRKEGKKPHRKMTPDKLARIQEELNSGQSVNSIAKRENIAESLIRYHLTNGSLKKHQGKFAN